MNQSMRLINIYYTLQLFLQLNIPIFDKYFHFHTYDIQLKPTAENAFLIVFFAHDSM